MELHRRHLFNVRERMALQPFNIKSLSLCVKGNIPQYPSTPLSDLFYNLFFQLRDVFEKEIDRVMRGLGYCCGRKYKFGARTLPCYGKELCCIPVNKKYYNFVHV